MNAADLRVWRARRGWTQERAAKAIGYSKRGYQIAEKSEGELSRKLELAIKGFEAGEASS